MMPSLFLAHGAPTLAIEDNTYVEYVKNLASQFPKPRAIVLFTAHWEHPVQQVSSIDEYPMIYDFYGFPDELYRVTYPAKGDQTLAAEVHQLFQQAGVNSALDTTRGVDHGTWTVLKLLYPEANIPVIQLSVNTMLSNAEQYAIGKALASLREQDILVIGSGGTVHNLRAVYWDATEPNDMALAFDKWLENTLTAWDLDALFEYDKLAPHARFAVPRRSEHFIPLLLAMGAADNDRKARLLFRDYQFGTLSLSAWQFGK